MDYPTRKLSLATLTIDKNIDQKITHRARKHVRACHLALTAANGAIYRWRQVGTATHAYIQKQDRTLFRLEIILTV